MVGLRSSLALVVLLLAAGPVAAQTEVRATDIQVKAAYLYKFGGFVEWPPSAFASPQNPIVIGIVGNDALAAELEQAVRGRTVQDRPIAVRRIRRGEASSGLHILFIGQSEGARIGPLVAATRDQPVLVVTDVEDALPEGSMINFVSSGDKLRFDIAPPAPAPGQIKISARLLAVARKVVPRS